MNIYYYPQYSGLIYYGLNAKKTLDFDAKALDTEGLVDFFSLHAGLIYPAENRGDRLVQYGKAIEKAIGEKPKNLFAQSYYKDPINTTLQCLKWRDILKLAKWDGKKSLKSPRIESLKEIESQLGKAFPCCLADKIQNLIDKYNSGAINLLPNENEIIIYLSCPQNLLHPTIGDLLKCIEPYARTVSKVVKVVEPTIKKTQSLGSYLGQVLLNPESVESKNVLTSGVNIDINSTNLEIISFDDLSDASNYLAYLDAKAHDVWINTSNDKLPYFIKKARLPEQDISAAQGFSQIRQLLIAGLNLFYTPLNLSVLMQWLSLPIHPLKKDFRNKLVYAISSTNSLYNDDCRKLIREYAYPKGKKSKKQADAVSTFIPNVTLNDIAKNISFNASNSNVVQLALLKKFLNDLKKWTNSNFNSSSGFYSQEVLDELPKISADIDMVLEILKFYPANQPITEIQLTNIIQAVYEYPLTKVSHSVVGSKPIINSPELIAADGYCNHIIWCDFYGDQTKDTMYSFLNKQEIGNAALMGLSIWDKEKELNMYRYFQIIPFIKSADGAIDGEEKPEDGGILTLVVCKRDGAVSFREHPFMTIIDKFKELGLIPQKCYIDGKTKLNELVKTSQMKHILDNTLDSEAAPYYTISQLSGAIKWPQVSDSVYPSPKDCELKRYFESYTSVNELINFPMSYVLRYLGKIKEQSFDALAADYTLKGNVAHRVIESLFSGFVGKKGPYSISDPDIGKTFETSVDELALKFREPSFTMELAKFKDKVIKCVKTLLEIINTNDMQVGGCEEKFSDIKFFSATNIRRINSNSTFNASIGETADRGFILNGSIDMWLFKENEDGTKKYYIFDFKWTSKEDIHIGKLKQNKSVQLCLYKHSLIHHLNLNVAEEDIETAYYILTSAHLYTCSKNIKESCNPITMDAKRANVNLLSEIMNSYEYRKSEIMSGKIEDAEHVKSGLSCYSRDESPLGLLPLEIKNGCQVENTFNDYSVFTSKR